MKNNSLFLTKLLCFSFILFFSNILFAQKEDYKVVAYISQDSASLVRYDYKKITHLIYGFGHVGKEGNFSVGRKKDSIMLRAMKSLKIEYPKLKTMIALGGWTGCEICSEVFSDPQKRQVFANSVDKFISDFHLDGIDLDWEYPAIQGPPGHLFQDVDKANFTDLLRLLKEKLGKDKLVTFAAGGFQDFLEKSVEWDKITPYVDFVNLMTYDLVHGYSTETGHQSALYSPRSKDESINRAVDFFKKNKFPLEKVIVGVPFYHRYFEVSDTSDHGLFKSSKFLSADDYKFNHLVLGNEYFKEFWDRKAKVPYWFNADKKIFVTGDNKKSIELKIKYIKKQQLGGIMFWELASDRTEEGLLDAIKF